MARYFYLLTAFDRRTDADKFIFWMQKKPFTLTSGSGFSCHVQSWVSKGNLTWVSCEPQGVSLGTRTTADWLVRDAGQLDEVAGLLYRSLFDAGDFCCALAGWEAADLFLPPPESGYADLRLDPVKWASPGWDGLVLSDAHWRTAGKPEAFLPFCDGYLWQPYRTLSGSGW
ncbi:MAG: hypothetical protein AB1846_14130 [Chloroflexota bacterium]